MKASIDRTEVDSNDGRHRFYSSHSSCDTTGDKILKEISTCKGHELARSIMIKYPPLSKGPAAPKKCGHGGGEGSAHSHETTRGR